MDTLNKLKDINLTNRFLDKIKSEVVSEISIMEVCGTHTNVILKNGKTCKKVAVYVENYYSKSNT